MLKKVIQDPEPEDLIWLHPKAISLSFKEVLKKVNGDDNPSYMIPSKSDLQIVELGDLGFSGITVKNELSLFERYFGYKRTNLGPVYFFPYYGGVPADDFSNVGRLGNIPLCPNLAEPQYVITGEMQGCAIIITKEAGASTFTAWHFQSPGSGNNRDKLREFLKLHRNEIYSYLCFSDYRGPYNGKEYDITEIEGFNYLFFNRKNNQNEGGWAAGTWELRCIPLKRIPKYPFVKGWGGFFVDFSSKGRFIRPIDFNHPIPLPDNLIGNETIEWMVNHITYDASMNTGNILEAPPIKELIPFFQSSTI
ncbi:hypothetical protein C1631_006905 [Chryseobacterium phosphatilyticum]|uniref:Uncharacterized protein n=1 Tax=Chryseobacterium phosphatilyticum TaxID=475075 RepID=A0A316XER0_9FLAO|nr:hypothetical protein [Chryseobacterium phosphatilyticum]PWN72321.1 hypothetical protein C1631_006905 [Chryseobacterium phosphatilyticum]